MTNLEIVDALARLQLVARRNGCRVVVTRAPDDVTDLIELCGLAGVLAVEPRRQAEEREQPVRVEEERQLDDLPIP
jgi:anti-anti-sigma regulatory factor